MYQTSILIDSDNFVALFITLKQLEMSEIRDYLSLSDWSFSINALNSFLFYAKHDPKYKDLLVDFSIIFSSNGIISKELAVSLNRAKERHLLSAIADDKAYVSRAYLNPNILREYANILPLMEELVRDFNIYCYDPDTYVAELQNIASSSKQVTAATERNLYSLIREVNGRQIEYLEDKN